MQSMALYHSNSRQRTNNQVHVHVITTEEEIYYNQNQSGISYINRVQVYIILHLRYFCDAHTGIYSYVENASCVI